MLNTLTTKAYVVATEAVRNFKDNEKGVTAIEYGLIAICITAFIIYTFYSEGGFIDNMVSKFSSLGTTIGTVSASRWSSTSI